MILSNVPPLARIRLDRLLGAAAATAALFTVACTDPNETLVYTRTLESTFTVSAMTGSAPGAATALNLAVNGAVRADADLYFDVAFDINSEGKVVLYPIRLVAWEQLGVHLVGIQKADVAFDEVERAPSTGFNYEESFIGEVGDVFVIESYDPRACPYPNPPRLVAKILIEVIDLDARVILLRMRENPNCGLRSLLEGIPTN